MYNNDCETCITFIQHIIGSCGWSYIWTEQCTTIFTVKWASAAIRGLYKSSLFKKWANDINKSSKSQIYKVYKQNFGFEYLSILTKKIWKPLITIHSEHQISVYQLKLVDGMEFL